MPRRPRPDISLDDLPLTKSVAKSGKRVPAGARKITARIGGRGTTAFVAKRNAQLDGQFAELLQKLLDAVRDGELPRKGSAPIGREAAKGGRAVMSWEVSPRGKLISFSMSRE